MRAYSIDPMGGETTLAYDANGNMITFTDPRGSITRFEYDARDRQNRRIDPLLNAETFVYDGKGNLVERTERGGKLTSFTYDAINRLSKAEYGRTRSKQGNLSNPDATVNYTYDAGNRPTQVVDTQGGTITRAYNGLSQITSETSPKGSVGYTYDLIGRRLTLAVTGQPTSTYGYDDLNALTRITRGSNEVGLSYDTVGRRQTLTLPNGIVATYTYDDAGQLTGIQYSRGGSALGDLTYAYDAAGQRIEMGGSFARMTLPPALGNAVYDAANRLTSWDGTAHTYDLNGNLTNDGSRVYTWDSRNRLSGITGGATAAFKYDGTDRRYEKTVSGTATGFLYDGLNPVHEMTGTTTAVKASLMTGFGLDQFFARSDAAGTASMLSDALGSTIALTDANGAMTTQYTYEPYGKTTQDGAASESAFQYTGRENDGTGLYYYRARYYDPAKSRFIGEDPIGLAGGNNAYSYVNGRPLDMLDPLGLAACGCDEGPGYLNNLWKNFSDVNGGLPGATIPSWLPGVGLGTMTAGGVARAVGSATPLQYAMGGFNAFAGFTQVETLTAIAGTSLLNFAMATVAYESGALLGSAINAIPVGKCGRTVRDVLSGS